MRSAARSSTCTPIPGAFARARTGHLPLTALNEMEAGGVETAFFAAVGDGLVIRREGTGIQNFRDPVPGSSTPRPSASSNESAPARARTGSAWCCHPVT